MKFSLCESGTYSTKSPNMAADRAINMFPEAMESPTAKTRFGFLGTPGLRKRWVLSDGPVRPGPSSFITIPFSLPTVERTFCVSGSTLFETFAPADWSDITALGTSTARGNVGTDGFPVYFAFNGTQLAIVSAQQLFILNTTTNVLTGPILDSEGEALLPISVVFKDGYFLINKAATQNVFYSDLYDGESWPALNFFAAEDNPDRALVLLVDHDLLWVFGDQTIQPFQNVGDPDTPFQPYKAGTLQQGLGAPASVAQLDNAFFFLGKDPARGGLIAWRANGTSLERVSNHSVEQFWESYSRTDDALSYAFVMQGHAFWQITFPEANWTWRYDCSTNMWHEPLCWNTRTAGFEAHHSWNHTSAFGKHLVGDRGGTCCQDEPPTEPVVIDTSCPLPDATEGEAYSTTIQASGGTPPYTYAITSGTLQAGLTFDGTVDPATITGTPTESSTVTLTFEAIDSVGAHSEPKECNLTVSEAVGTFSGQIPLEMLIAPVVDAVVDTAYYSMAVRIDPADYDGLSAVYFQGCLRSFSGVRSVQLVDENGTLYATIATSGTVTYTRIRSTAVTIDPVNAHEYQFKVPGNALDAQELIFFDCKALVEVQNSNRVKIQILLTAGTAEEGGDEATEDANNQSAVANYSAIYTTYDYVGLPAVVGVAPGTRPYFHNLFYKDESKFATIDEWELEVSGFHFQNTPCGCSANCQAALYNFDTGLQVTGTNLGPWSPGATAALPEIKRITFSNSAANFTDLAQFQLLSTLNPSGLPDGCRFNIVRAALYVTLTGASIKAQIYHKLSLERENIAGTVAHNWTRYLHEPTKYNAGTVFYHEVTGNITTAGTGTQVFWLFDAGTSDVLTAGSNLVGSDLTMDATRTRWRSAALTMTDGNRYYGRDVGTGTAKSGHSHHFLIAEVPPL